MVVEASPPARSGWRLGLYWVYAILLSLASVFWLAIASPIIRPTLPSHPEHLLFCIFAGIAIADAAAHAINDVAAIWKPHDLGGARSRRQKFSVRRFLMADIQRLASHLSAVPIIGLVAFAYTLLTPHIEDRLFGHSASEGAVFWNFVSQGILGGIDVFAFFLSHEAKETVRNSLHLVELSPASFEAGAVLAGLKLYGVLIFVSALRLAGAPIVLLRTWAASKRQNQPPGRRKKRADD